MLWSPPEFAILNALMNGHEQLNIERTRVVVSLSISLSLS